ncbi:MAG: heme-binding domain-containing protein [Anaerolineales bacterium]|nr:heme-binding domain-containing protein [Anaerolineales bacterium]
MTKYLKLILKAVAGLALLGILGVIAIQFVPVKTTNPPVVSEPQWDSPQTKALVERACYDCHSNETKWTWYSKIAPVSWYVAHDVQEGRDALNFSEWRVSKGEGAEGREDDEGEEFEEITEVISEGEMPPRQYLLMHPEARLTDTEINALIAGLKATFGAEGAMVK